MVNTMTTNVPQDVMENTHKPDLIEKLSGLARSIEVCEGWRPTCIDEAIAKLRDQRAGGEAVGAAVTSPDDPGFTMACFEASDVPAGTMLFTQQHPVRESGEAVAYLDYNGELKPTRHGIITMKKGDNLYTTPPQANALVAAAYMKAAEICKDLNTPAAALKCAPLILSAIPADAEAALREVSEKLAEAIKGAFKDEIASAKHFNMPGVADALEAFQDTVITFAVNSVLGEGGK
jgi:hypothetical protein